MSSSKQAIVLGAGIAGLMVSEVLLRRGWKVTIHDKRPLRQAGPCSRTAAAMLAPYSELETAEPAITKLGVQALPLWDELIERIAPDINYQRKGTLTLAHRRDHIELERLKHRIDQVDSQAGSWTNDPKHGKALFISDEGHLDGAAWMGALISHLLDEGLLWSPTEPTKADCIIDCRGLGAQEELNDLRPVRGELILLHAPDLELERPIRLLHPRYPLYLVPRPHQHILVGSSCLESASEAPTTVRTALEMLAAAYSIKPQLSEASIVGQRVGLRPAFPNNLPRVSYSPTHISVNGLYRHGFLLSPILAKSIADYLDDPTAPQEDLPCRS